MCSTTLYHDGLFWGRGQVSRSPEWLRTCSIAEADLELLILLPSPNCWDHSHVLSCLGIWLIHRQFRGRTTLMSLNKFILFLLKKYTSMIECSEKKCVLWACSFFCLLGFFCNPLVINTGMLGLESQLSSEGYLLLFQKTQVPCWVAHNHLLRSYRGSDTVFWNTGRHTHAWE